MAVSYIGAGLLPLVEELLDIVRVFVWYYCDSSEPLINGVAWGNLGILIGGARQRSRIDAALDQSRA